MSAPLTPAGIVAALTTATPATVDVARDALPAAPGLYAWWAPRGALPVPHSPHPLDRRLGLVYVGISPSSARSRQSMSSRVLKNHLGNGIGSSTFRYVLAALLIDELPLRPLLTLGGSPTLGAEDNERLAQWQRENLRLTWCERGRPWEVEAPVIASMKPPCNVAGNGAHQFYAEVRRARAALRAAAT